LHSVRERLRRPEFNRLIEERVEDAMAAISRALTRARLREDQIATVLLIGGTSRIPLIQDKMRVRFGLRVTTVEDPDAVIARGAALVHALRMMPVLAHGVAVRLSDNQPYEIFAAGAPADPLLCQSEVRFFCTDPRDGLAKLVLLRTAGRHEETFCVLPIRVGADFTRLGYSPERVTCRFSLDRDLILNVDGRGATQDARSPATAQLLDLRFGLRLNA
jgi:molecular chaperone DnaK